MKRFSRLRLRQAFMIGLGSLLAFPVVSLLTALLIIMRSSSGNAKLPADCAIVFGAAVYGYSQPGPAIQRRIGKAIALQKEGSVNRLILTGGFGKGAGVSLSEAEVMRREAMGDGVAGDRLIVEDASRSTKENLLFSRPLAKSCNSVVGISDGYHLARILLLARQQGWDELTVIPTDLHPQARSEVRSIIREMFGYLYYGLHMDTLGKKWGWIPGS